MKKNELNAKKEYVKGLVNMYINMSKKCEHMSNFFKASCFYEYITNDNIIAHGHDSRLDRLLEEHGSYFIESEGLDKDKLTDCFYLNTDGDGILYIIGEVIRKCDSRINYQIKIDDEYYKGKNNAVVVKCAENDYEYMKAIMENVDLDKINIGKNNIFTENIGNNIGYSINLNNGDYIYKMSHIFSDSIEEGLKEWGKTHTECVIDRGYKKTSLAAFIDGNKKPVTKNSYKKEMATIKKVGKLLETLTPVYDDLYDYINSQLFVKLDASNIDCDFISSKNNCDKKLVKVKSE